MEKCGVTAQSFHLCSLPNLGLTPVMPFFPLSGAGSTCMFPAFGARPSPTGDLPFLPPRASQCPPDTEKQRHASRWENASGSKSWSTGGNPPTGLGLASHWSYSRLEKLGEKGNELLHLMTRKKMCFGQIFTLRWLNLCIWFSLNQMIWTQCTPWYFVLWIWVTILSPFLISFFLLLSPHQGKKRKLLNQWEVLIFPFGMSCSTQF